jgi:hypothetical protein
MEAEDWATAETADIARSDRAIVFMAGNFLVRIWLDSETGAFYDPGG